MDGHSLSEAFHTLTRFQWPPCELHRASKSRCKRLSQLDELRVTNSLNSQQPRLRFAQLVGSRFMTDEVS